MGVVRWGSWHGAWLRRNNESRGHELLARHSIQWKHKRRLKTFAGTDGGLACNSGIIKQSWDMRRRHSKNGHELSELAFYIERIVPKHGPVLVSHDICPAEKGTWASWSTVTAVLLHLTIESRSKNKLCGHVGQVTQQYVAKTKQKQTKSDMPDILSWPWSIPDNQWFMLYYWRTTPQVNTKSAMTVEMLATRLSG